MKFLIEFSKSLTVRIRQSSAARNFGWLLADRCIRLMVGVVVGCWVARYLGKADFGALNYTIALVTIASAVAPLGMDMLAVREIVRKPGEAGGLIGTITGFRLFGAIALLVAVGIALILMRPGETNLQILLLIFGVGVLGQSLEAGEILFQARVEMRRLVVPRLVVFLSCNVVKVVMILNGCSIFCFAVLTSVEQVSCGTLTWFFTRRNLGKNQSLSFSLKQGLGLLAESWPLALSGIAVIIYMKSGQIMIGNLLGNAGVGVFSAGIRIPEVFYFIPSVLASSMLPGLLTAQKQGAAAYELATLRFMRLNALLSISLALVLSIGSGLAVVILYGKAFASAAPVMAIYSWTLIFVFMGVARGQFLLNDRRTLTSFAFSMTGLALNLALSFWLIPRYKVTGAAIASVATQALATIALSFVLPWTRALGLLQLRALLTPWRGLRRLKLVTCAEIKLT